MDGSKFEFLKGIGSTKQPSIKDTLDGPGNEDHVAAAVTLVVSSARHGMLTLCANVAHVIRQKRELQDHVARLEKQLIALENNINGSVSVNSSCSCNSHVLNLNSSQESPINQRCGSAPAGFIASGLKFLRGDCQSNVTSGYCDSSELSSCDRSGLSNAISGFPGVHESPKEECRTSSISMPETQSELVPKIVNNVEKRTSFMRGHSQASTRSLNVSQSLPVSSFVRRKYSTISLRRVRRNAASRQKSSSLCSSTSINSYASCTHSEERRRSSNNSSCIITVAEVHNPPVDKVTPENTEEEAVKLLARTLTSVLQGDMKDHENSFNSSMGDTKELQNQNSIIPKTTDNQELCLPHPLTGCECIICLRLTADPTTQLYALTTDGGSLLPPGSRVLVEGERIGTVMYMGHERYPKGHNPLHSGSVDACWMQESYDRPVGITLKVWAPDQGETFVPLSAVICQLDDDFDLHRKESWSSFEYEYLDEDSDEEEILPHSDSSVEQISDLSSQDVSGEHAENSTSKMLESEETSVTEDNPSVKDYFVKTPSVSSYGSVDSHSLGDLSNYGLECMEDDTEFGKEDDFEEDSHDSLSLHQTSFSHDEDFDSEYGLQNFCEDLEVSSSDPSVLNTTFVSKALEEGTFQGRDRNLCYSGSLYDTCDSAISLSFSRRLQYSEENCESSALTDTDRDSPYFGDTWDSGCSVGRTRCRSDSSGHYSDIDCDSIRIGVASRSLGEALDNVLAAQKNKRKMAVEKAKHSIENEFEKDVFCNTEVTKRGIPKRLWKNDPLRRLENPLTEMGGFLAGKYQLDGTNTGHSEV